MGDDPAESIRGYVSALAAQQVVCAAETCGTREFRERANGRAEESSKVRLGD